MPVQPLPKETEAEGDSAAEMNGEEESEDEHSASQSESEEESSEMDEEDYERRRSECLDEMSDLEKQFSELKETLFKERLNQVKAKLEDVMAGKAAEYLDPLGVLQKHMQIRIEVAGIYRGFCLDIINHKHRCELQGARQHLESEKLLLFDTLQERLLERIQRLEDDRHSVGLTSEWWDDKLRPKHNAKDWDPFRPGKRKKPPLVSDILLSTSLTLLPGGFPGFLPGTCRAAPVLVLPGLGSCGWVGGWRNRGHFLMGTPAQVGS
uniref:BRMS1 transcriptional repressor and anoikis regulator n=1 Tax=Varanus komodoensis TaxID=61221 RepID=A0A8D2LC78_VARKO